MPCTRRPHWDRIYGAHSESDLSWYEARPSISLQLIEATGIGRAAPILDVGGGASLLVDALVAAGYTDVTVVDVSARALERVRERLGTRAASVQRIEADVTCFSPERRYSVWHDRAVFHFLTDAADRARYRRALEGAVVPGGHAILATFAPEGPPRCSGLEVVRYSPSDLAAELGATVDLVESLEHVHVTPDGREQPFTWCRFVVPGRASVSCEYESARTSQRTVRR